MIYPSAPFIYFGGKSSIAPQVWESLGAVNNYVEPFCGSCAVLLARPQWSWPADKIAIETVNDFDGFVANFWRCLTSPSRAGIIAEMMNYPVSEVDLEARHRWLVRQPGKDEFLARMRNDHEYCDVKRAAFWCWGLCQWIGGGWCGGEYFGDGDENNHGRGTCNGAAKLPHLGGSRGVHKQLPHLGDAGMGVHKKLPHLGDAGRGVHKQRPHLGDAGRGVHKQLPHLGDAGRGVHKQLPHLGSAGMGEFARRGEVLEQWMLALADRLRGVRVCCGDWLRVCGSESTTTTHGITGVFLDPPYSAEAGRDNGIYRCEDGSVAHRVREWCLERGPDPQMRIILCGYEGEGHEELERAGWRVEAWKAQGGYANQNSDDDSAGKINAKREQLWYSPHCFGHQPGLFGATDKTVELP